MARMYPFPGARSFFTLKRFFSFPTWNPFIEHADGNLGPFLCPDVIPRTVNPPGWHSLTAFTLNHRSIENTAYRACVNFFFFWSGVVPWSLLRCEVFSGRLEFSFIRYQYFWQPFAYLFVPRPCHRRVFPLCDSSATILFSTREVLLTVTVVSKFCWTWRFFFTPFFAIFPLRGSAGDQFLSHRQGDGIRSIFYMA